MPTQMKTQQNIISMQKKNIASKRWCQSSDKLTSHEIGWKKNLGCNLEP